MGEIKNKVVLVTGTSWGIGRATASLARERANVIINHNSNERLANEVLRECNKYSKNNLLIKTNITNEGEEIWLMISVKNIRK